LLASAEVRIAAPRPLFDNFRWILSGNVATAAAQWGIIAVLARFGVPQILGAYSLGISVAALVSGVANLELRTLQVTDATQQTPFAVYYLLRFWMSMASVVFLSGFALVSRYSWEARAAILAMALSKCSDGWSDTIYGRLQVRERMALIGKSQLAKSGLFLLLPCLSLAFLPNPMWAIGSMIIPSAAVLIFYDLPNLRRYGGVSIPAAGRKGLRKFGRRMLALAKVGLPPTIVTTLVTLHVSIPRFVVASQLGESQAGVVTALGYLAIAPNLVMVALGQAGMAPLARSFAVGDGRGFLTGVLRLVGAGVMVGGLTLIAGLTLGGPILAALYGPPYANYDRVLLLFLVAGALSYLNAAVGYGLASARVFGMQMPLMTVVCIVGLLTSVALVPRLGVAGAGASLVISLLTQLILYIALISNSLRMRLCGK
jgi:O-antigen/teichoic acid export membrane protein